MIVTVDPYHREDFEKYGVSILTGEACAYGHRLLCDLNEEGVQLLSDYLGIQPTAFYKNWNSKVNNKPAVASIMLSRDVFQDLAKFILLHVERVTYLLDHNDSEVHGSSGWSGYDDEALEQYSYLQQLRQEGKIYINWSVQCKQPQVNGRNVHGFSGRAL